LTYKIKHTTQFKKDYKRAKTQGRDINILVEVLGKLKNDENLDYHFNDHQLLGHFSDFRECHLKPDWLLIYYKDKKTKTIILTRLGNHSDLFS